MVSVHISKTLTDTVNHHNHQPKSTHRGTHGSSCLSSRGWPCWSSMGGEVLGPVKAPCPSVGECQDREAGMGGLVSRRSRGGHRGVLKGKPGSVFYDSYVVPSEIVSYPQVLKSNQEQ